MAESARRVLQFLVTSLLFCPVSVLSADAQRKITPAELDQALYAYADRYTTHIVSATEAIERGNPSPEQRRLAHIIKLVSVSAIYDTVTQPDTFSKLMDALAMVTLQSYSWIDEDRAEKAFGERGEPLRRAVRESRNDIWNLAARVLRPDQLQQVDAVILDWRRQNPKVDIVANIRFDQLSADRNDGTAEEIRKTSGLFAEIATASKAVDDMRLLAERAFYQAKRTPLLVSWQVEGLLNEVLANPDLRVTLKAAESLAVSADRVSLAVEKIPAQVRSERQIMLAALDERRDKVSSLLGEVRQTAAVGDHLAASALKVAESGERLTLNLRETVSGLAEATRAVDALLMKHPAPERPFEIEHYLKTAIELNQTVAGVNSALTSLDTLTDRKPWSPPMRDVQIAFAGEIDRLFWRALLLMAAFFAMLLAYRWLAQKMSPRV